MARENPWMSKKSPRQNGSSRGSEKKKGGELAGQSSRVPLIQGELFPRMGLDGRDIGLIIEVRRSTRRKKTIEAYRNGEKVIVSIPARMSQREANQVVDEMVKKILHDESRPTNSELFERAQYLNQKYLDGKAVPVSVEWSSRMSRIWGACTIEDKAIRISDRLRDAPEYALDYLLIHELIHILIPGHGAEFRELLMRYPQLERAEGYFEGRTHRPSGDFDQLFDE
jgi:predicted metal-dependent hydrolase